MKRSVGLKETFMSSKEGMLLWNQEQAILDTTDLICDTMRDCGVSRAQLAALLGTTKGYITQLLDGSANMTIRKISDVFTVLGQQFVPSCKPLPAKHRVHFEVGFSLDDSEFADASGWTVASPSIKVE